MGNQITYDDLTDSQLELLEAANLRYHNFLGHCGALNEQARQDRETYPHLLTLRPSGEGRLSEEKSVEFLMAVTGLPHEVCAAYQTA